jgi:peptide/nickel transport system ATP-binding protein
VSEPGLRDESAALLRVEHLVVDHRSRRGKIRAVNGVNFDILPGETLGLVGESGCGKSSTARAIVQAPPPSAGRVIFDGVDLTSLSRSKLRLQRPGLQMIFQDPISSLNPRRRIGNIIAEPLKVWGRTHGGEQRTRVRELLANVGFVPDAVIDRQAHELSGGQCQRVSIARALALEPKLVICDEPVSALDVSVQAQILNLLHDLQAEYGLALLFIAHDLAVVKNISDRVAVMYLGTICELGAADTVYEAPAHPYTAALLAAVPEPDPAQRGRRATRIAGEPPSPANPPSGCPFRTRCPRAEPVCAAETPQLERTRDGRLVACHFPLIGQASPALPHSSA